MKGRVQQIAKTVNGQLFGDDVAFDGVSTDTRQIKAGELFIALRGANFDGDQFVSQAMDQGAIAAIVHQRQQIDLPQIVVADTRLALADIARAHRRAWQGTLFALTGSNGKTTTKELLRRVLAQRGKVLATSGNLNNDIGVPLTLLNLDGDEAFAVVEMGANHVGEIAYLTNIAEPDVVLVTNISAAHIEGFGSLEHVFQAKSELYAYSGDAAMVVNMDMPYATQWLSSYADRRCATFGLTQTADVMAQTIRRDVRAFDLSWDGESVGIKWGLVGKHNVANALAAFAAAQYVGCDLTDAQSAWTDLVLQHSRLTQYQVGNHTVYDDTYNANVASFCAGIDVIAGAEHTLVIAGAMGEMGAAHEQAHRNVVRYAFDHGITAFWCVGEAARAYLCDVGFASSVLRYFATHAEAAAALQLYLSDQQDAVQVLVKGSRSAMMERVLTWLHNDPCHEC